ncbi:MAG: cell division protein FtsX [Desulfovibrio sp.]
MANILQLTGRGIKDIFIHPWAQLLSYIAVVTVTLLTGACLTLLFNVNEMLHENRGEVAYQVFWQVGYPQKDVEKQWAELKKAPELAESNFYTPHKALTELSMALGGNNDFKWLDGRNPLPASALLLFSVPESGPLTGESYAKETLKKLKRIKGVEKVHYNPMQLELAQGWTKFSNSVIWPVIGFFGLVVAIIVGNTIKLSLISRQDEVDILFLVGARPWYIRWPLLTGGFVQGIIGSGSAAGLLYLFTTMLKDSLNIPPLFLTIKPLPIEQVLILCGAVTFVCVFSSFVSIRTGSK